MQLKYQNYTQYKNKKGIYRIAIGNYLYVGSSVSLFSRIRKHYGTLMTGSHENKRLLLFYNKHKNCKIDVIELLADSVSELFIKERERYYIDLIKPTINIVKNPLIGFDINTVAKEVFQFDLKGNFIKKWKSATDAAFFYKINSSNISHVCGINSNQKTTAGFLWSYTINCKPSLIYVYDDYGNFINSFANTIEVYTSLFLNINKKRKTALSLIKAYLDKDIHYCNFRFYSSFQGLLHRKRCLNTKEIRENKYFYQYDLEGNYLNCYTVKELIKLKIYRKVKYCLSKNKQISKYFIWSTLKKENIIKK